MLYAYIDASGDNRAERVLSVAGFVGGERLWSAWNDRWAHFLSEFDVPHRFHASEYWARYGAYQRWTDAKHAEAYQRISGNFNDVMPYGVGIAVDIDVFDEWRASLGVFVDPDPYFFCLEFCLRAFVRGVKEEPADDGIMIYVDRDNQRNLRGVQLTNWLANRTRLDPPAMHDRERQIKATYQSSAEHPPLQAADILANGLFRKMKSEIEPNKDDPFWSQNSQSFLHCMENNANPPILRLFTTRAHFEIDWKIRLKSSSAGLSS